MTFSGGADPGPDLLSGGDNRSTGRRAALTVAVMGALALGAFLLVRADPQRTGGSRETAATAPPTPASHRPAAPSGSVFLEHLPRCTRTDHHHALTVAFGVSNLGPGALVLLGATPLTSDDGVLRLTGLRLGDGTCAGHGSNDPVRLAPADQTVVAMTFRVSARCPHGSLLAARVSFDAGSSGIVHSDSSALTDLNRLDFAQC